jgi:hypothetical protein
LVPPRTRRKKIRRSTGIRKRNEKGSVSSGVPRKKKNVAIEGTVIRALKAARILVIVTIGDATKRGIDREVLVSSKGEAGAQDVSIMTKTADLKLAGVIDRGVVATNVGGIVPEAAVLVTIIVGVVVRRGEMTTIKEIATRSKSLLIIGAMRKGVKRSRAIIRKQNGLLAQKAMGCRVASLCLLEVTATSVLIDSYCIENDKSEIQSVAATVNQGRVVDA